MSENFSPEVAQAEFNEWRQAQTVAQTVVRYHNEESELLDRSRRENYLWYESLQLAEQAAGHPKVAEEAWNEVRGREILVNRLQTALVAANPSKFVELTEEGSKAETIEMPAVAVIPVPSRGDQVTDTHETPMRRLTRFLTHRAS